MDKKPSEYGAFPGDPYSHTPSMKGVQQPGMTGQVKEDIISRFIELGVGVRAGKLRFKPILLRKQEFIRGDKGTDSLAFSFCGTPVRFITGEKLSAHIYYSDGEVESCDDAELNLLQSQAVFSRSGTIKNIDVFIPENQLIII